MKYDELKDMTDEQLKQKEDALRKELVELRFKRAGQQLKNVSQIKAVKKDIARVLTALNTSRQRREKEKNPDGTSPA